MRLGARAYQALNLTLTHVNESVFASSHLCLRKSLIGNRIIVYYHCYVKMKFYRVDVRGENLPTRNSYKLSLKFKIPLIKSLSLEIQN